MARRSLPPLDWTVDDVDHWAVTVKLAEGTRAALKDNEVDG